jgi:hypothetical protein
LKTTESCLMFCAKCWQRAKVMKITYNATRNVHSIFIPLIKLIRRLPARRLGSVAVPTLMDHPLRLVGSATVPT